MKHGGYVKPRILYKILGKTRVSNFLLFFTSNSPLETFIKPSNPAVGYLREHAMAIFKVKIAMEHAYTI